VDHVVIVEISGQYRTRGRIVPHFRFLDGGIWRFIIGNSGIAVLLDASLDRTLSRSCNTGELCRQTH
jgi:hypothetical protein